MDIKAIIQLKRGKEQSILRRHPWIFSGAIHKHVGDPADGDLVKVESATGQVLGFGQYQKGSITVRMLSFDVNAPGEQFYHDKFRKALQLRTSTQILSDHTNACRLVHGEGDGLPGLIVDLYNGTAVVQAHSHGMHKDRKRIAEALHSIVPNLHSVFYKSQSALNDSPSEYLLGGPGSSQIITEHDNKFHIDWKDGQKTGFFVDQRENRALLGTYSSGRNVLNTFCYTGGFSVYALKGGASVVHSVDVSGRAIEMTKSNLELNDFDPSRHECFTADSFEFMNDRQDRYDLIVLDPPAFAKHKDSKHQAMKGYKRLNAEAMKIIRSGGIIFTFSCSQVVDRQLFYDTIVSAAIVAEREIKVLQHMGQPGDHPVSIYHREGEYLKGLVLYVG